MKIIVSHDVDHLFWREHFFKDLYISKLLVRSATLALKGVIDRKTLFARIDAWNDGRINRLRELMAYEKEMQVPATFFFVMRPGKGVAYQAMASQPFIREMLRNNISVGVHGMAYDDPAAMKEEHARFKEISGLETFGIRMHYLRQSTETLNILDQLGYSFDSSKYEVEAPSRMGNMIEFPISVMDTYAVRPQHRTIDTAKAYTLKKLEDAEKANLPFFTINFHDMLFNPAYALYKEWFTWIIELCIQRGYQFTNFEKAMPECR